MVDATRRRICMRLLIAAVVFSPLSSYAFESKPLRVYVLVGQSNMVGTGAISTFDYIGDDPATASLLQSMLNEERKPKTCERVWISSLNGKYRKPGGEGYGKLSPGYGLWKEDPTRHGDCIGKYYRYMIEHVKKVVGDINRVCPDYDSKAGYELAGFVWFQGWNDYAATAQYPRSKGEEQFASYRDLLCHFICDVRKDLKAPKLPFVIGVIGVNGNHTPGLFSGPANAQEKMERLRKAMAAPATLPEFKETVVAVPTGPFWDDKLGALGMKQLKIQRMRTSLHKKSKSGPNADGSMSQANIKQFIEDYNAKVFTPEDLALKQRSSGTGGFVHYYGSAKFHAQAGQAFAQALLKQQSK